MSADLGDLGCFRYTNTLAAYCVIYHRHHIPLYDAEDAKATEVKEDAEEGLKQDFQELRELITDEGGHTGTLPCSVYRRNCPIWRWHPSFAACRVWHAHHGLVGGVLCAPHYRVLKLAMWLQMSRKMTTMRRAASAAS